VCASSTSAARGVKMWRIPVQEVGTSLFAEVNALHRIRCDSALTARHAVVLPVVGYAGYSNALPGRDDQIKPLIQATALDTAHRHGTVRPSEDLDP
jgi:hypothetical protein